MYCRMGKEIVKENDKVVPWWSFGKTVIASAIMILVDQGKLDLTKTYGPLPGTLKQVLRHDAGYPDYGGVKVYHDAVDANETPWSFEILIEKTNKKDALFEPGQGWMYSNIGYYHLSKLIESTTKKSLQEALDELIFNPLNLQVKVALDRDDLKMCDHIKPDYHPKWVYHGLMIGRLEDACIILHALANGQLISDQLLDEMKDAYRLYIDIGDRPWQAPSYALGLMMDQSDQSFGHTGQGPDSVICVYHFPNEGVTIASSMNTYDQGKVENYIKTLV